MTVFRRVLDEFKKCSDINEYIRGDRLVGYVLQTLQYMVQEAIAEKNHPLHQVARGIVQYPECKEAKYSFIATLQRMVNEDDHSDPDRTFFFQTMTLIWGTLPAIQTAVKQAIKHIEHNEDHLLKAFPMKITQWAAMALQEKKMVYSRLKLIIENPQKVMKIKEEKNQGLRAIADEIRMKKQSVGGEHNYSDSQVTDMIIKCLSLPLNKRRNIRRIISK